MRVEATIGCQVASPYYNARIIVSRDGAHIPFPETG